MQQAAATDFLSDKRQTVAIVDDESSVRVGLKRLLDTYGYTTETFSSGEAFLEHGSANKISCIVLDIHLDGMSGIEVRRRLAKKGCKIPVIFMTALDNAVIRKEAMEVGCADFLGKPFSGHTLVASIRKALSSF